MARNICVMSRSSDVPLEESTIDDACASGIILESDISFTVDLTS
jgi:hypothetical protein